jgi:hypothetical protein
LPQWRARSGSELLPPLRPHRRDAGWTSLSEAEQIAVIQAEDTPVDPSAAQVLCGIIACTRAALTPVKIALAEGAASYIRTLVALLGQAQFALSPRRAGMLYRSVLAVHAASMALDPSPQPADPALLAVRSSLPQRAQGIPIPGVKILARGMSIRGLVIGEYVRGGANTNTIEGFFSIFKRGMTGVYQHCSSAHLKRYLAEFDFRYN